MSDQTTDIDVMAVNLLQRERIAELEAENAKLRMNLDAYKQAEELWCRQDEKRDAENAKLREAAKAVCEAFGTNSGPKMNALAALLEGKADG